LQYGTVLAYARAKIKVNPVAGKHSGAGGVAWLEIGGTVRVAAFRVVFASEDCDNQNVKKQ
jgi:hypothetical protein